MESESIDLQEGGNAGLALRADHWSTLAVGKFLAFFHALTLHAGRARLPGHKGIHEAHGSADIVTHVRHIIADIVGRIGHSLQGFFYGVHVGQHGLQGADLSVDGLHACSHGIHVVGELVHVFGDGLHIPRQGRHVGIDAYRQIMHIIGQSIDQVKTIDRQQHKGKERGVDDQLPAPGAVFKGCRQAIEGLCRHIVR